MKELQLSLELFLRIDQSSVVFLNHRLALGLALFAHDRDVRQLHRLGLRVRLLHQPARILLHSAMPPPVDANASSENRTIAQGKTTDQNSAVNLRPGATNRLPISFPIAISGKIDAQEYRLSD